jgi:cyclopropane fatty-acyl-phospholipid synthase-like methyltransferase
MRVAKHLYSFGYRHFRAPWDGGGPRAELVELVESGRLPPCKAIDLGSGTGWNCIFLAQHGFDVTGVDYAPGAIDLGRRRAAEAGVTVAFVEDDLTDLRRVSGAFDLLVDYGTLDDLAAEARDLYVQNVLPLTHPGSRFLLYCFEWPTRWWEKFFPPMQLLPGEVERRFSQWFEIERVAGTTDLDLSKFQPGSATYLMTRKGEA